MNPDGLLQDLSKRVNANGIDLDRNFSVDTGAGQDEAKKLRLGSLNHDG